MTREQQVKEAAERIRRVEVNAASGDLCWISRVYDQAWGNPPNQDWNHDLRVVGMAYCEEHPADDHEPITREWLTSIGLEIQDMTDPPDWYADIPSLGYRVTVWMDQTATINYAPDFLPCKTRGVLRRLCVALGITIETAIGTAK